MQWICITCELVLIRRDFYNNNKKLSHKYIFSYTSTPKEYLQLKKYISYLRQPNNCWSMVKLCLLLMIIYQQNDWPAFSPFKFFANLIVMKIFLWFRGAEYRGTKLNTSLCIWIDYTYLSPVAEWHVRVYRLIIRVGITNKWIHIIKFRSNVYFPGLEF